MKSVGVIGAGTMGAGIAQAFATNESYQVILCDINLEFAKGGLERIKSGLDRQLSKDKLTQIEINEIMSRIEVGNIEAVANCDLIVEAAVEQFDLKKELFINLDATCKEDAIFASNTSSLSVTELSAGIGHPIIGMHFFNPAPVMKLVEVVKGLTTPVELVEKIEQIAKDIGKVPVVIQDSAGFVVNRVLIPMINEAVGIMADGTAKAEDIDMAMKLGANHPMGPLALGDLIGLDVCFAIMEVLQSETGDQKYRPHPMLKMMVRAGYLGRKSGQGFYTY